jgi:hypothetical protein
MATYTASASGNWSSTSVWGGSGPPGDGDIAIIPASYTVTITSNVGTVGGGGIKSIQVTGGTLQVSSPTQAITIYFGSTGTDPLGGGTATNPTFSSATMSGIFAAKGTVSLVGTATYPVTLTTANSSYSFYIHHQYGDYVAGAAQYGDAVITLEYCVISNLGVNSAGYQGFFCDTQASSANVPTVANCSVSNYYQFYCGSTSQQYLGSVANCYFTGRTGPQTMSFATSWSSGKGGGTFSYNTETSPSYLSGGSLGYFIYSSYRLRGAIITQNAVINPSNGTAHVGLLYQGGNGTTSGITCTNNAALNLPTTGPLGANPSSGIFYYAYAGESSTILNNVFDYCNQAYGLQADANTTTMTISGGWSRNSNYESVGQGTIACVYKGTWTLSNCVGVMEGGGASNALLVYNSATALVNHCTAVQKGSASSSIAFAIGDNTTLPASNCAVRACLAVGCAQGIADVGGSTASTFVNDGAPGGNSGCHHNGTYNNTASYYTTEGTLGGTNWTDGTHTHPNNSVYGDIDGQNPGFVDVTRTPTTWSSYLGGAGTLSDLAAQFSYRCGVIGGSYNANYTVANLMVYLLYGFQPTNTAFQAASYSGDPSTADASGNAWPGGVPGIGAMAVSSAASFFSRGLSFLRPTSSPTAVPLGYLN